MHPRFPVFLDLHQNNCVVIGGGRYAAVAVKLLLPFGAKVTVISPALCDELQKLDESGRIRYIPRRHFRGDCANAYLAVAATDREAVNIAVAQECKARNIPVNVASPRAYGTFALPVVGNVQGMTVAVCADDHEGEADMKALCAQLIKDWSALTPRSDSETGD